MRAQGVAYVLAPTQAAQQRLAGALRATTVMASPFINAVVSHWLEHGQCEAVLSAVRAECSVAAMAANAFSTDRQPPEGLRLCLGGGLTRDDCGRALQAVVAALQGNETGCCR